MRRRGKLCVLDIITDSAAPPSDENGPAGGRKFPYVSRPRYNGREDLAFMTLATLVLLLRVGRPFQLLPQLPESWRSTV